MSKQFLLGILVAFFFFGLSSTPTGFIVGIFSWVYGSAIVFHIYSIWYEKRIKALLEVKARQKLHIRRFIAAYDRLVEEGRITIYEPLVSEELRKSVKKK